MSRLIGFRKWSAAVLTVVGILTLIAMGKIEGIAGASALTVIVPAFFAANYGERRSDNENQ